MRPPTRASCSCCCAARSMDCRRCRRWAIRPTPALRGQIALAKSGEDAALPLDATFGLHPALKFLARELRREGTRGAARRGVALSRALAFRCAERARERRRASAWHGQWLDQSRHQRAAGGRGARRRRRARRQRAAGDAWTGRGGLVVAHEDRRARRRDAGATHRSVRARSAAVAAPRRCAGERRHRQ